MVWENIAKLVSWVRILSCPIVYKVEWHALYPFYLLTERWCFGPVVRPQCVFFLLSSGSWVQESLCFEIVEKLFKLVTWCMMMSQGKPLSSSWEAIICYYGSHYCSREAIVTREGIIWFHEATFRLQRIQYLASGNCYLAPGKSLSGSKESTILLHREATIFCYGSHYYTREAIIWL